MQIGHELIPYTCHDQGSAQFFTFTASGQIMSVQETCVGVSTDGKSVVFVKCAENDKSQQWDYRKEVSYAFNIGSQLMHKK